ncbi:MAG: nuclear transport factor 2 family protein [Flavobacterium sp.]|nr:nuclear transport factor 2 family protein [Flavobacterium sp.]
MSAKKLIQDFYKSEALINSELMSTYLHPEVLLDWNSSSGFKQLNYKEILDLTKELGKAYVRSKARISHLVKDGDQIAVRYSHYIKTVENPREEMLLAHFMVIWEVKDNLLYRGFQMSQLP